VALKDSGTETGPLQSRRTSCSLEHRRMWTCVYGNCQFPCTVLLQRWSDWLTDSG